MAKHSPPSSLDPLNQPMRKRHATYEKDLEKTSTASPRQILRALKEGKERGSEMEGETIGSSNSTREMRVEGEGSREEKEEVRDNGKISGSRREGCQEDSTRGGNGNIFEYENLYA